MPTRAASGRRPGLRLACPPMRRRGLLAHPRDYLADGQTWPYGRLVGHAPPPARLAQGLSRRLHAAKADESVRSVAGAAEVSPQAVLNLLNGTTWGDLPTIARIEAALHTNLWGREHR